MMTFKEFITANHELLKYPIMVTSIVLGLYFSKLLLGFDFSDVSEVGLNGVKFKEQRKNEVKQAVANNDEITYLRNELESIKKQLFGQTDSVSLAEIEEAVLVRNIEQSQTVSQEIAVKSFLTQQE